MRDILIASFDMEIGGVERSLLGMVENFDYENYSVNLMLYRHKGDFFNLIPIKTNLLNEINQYSSFRKGIGELIREKSYVLALTRILSKFNSKIYEKIKGIATDGCFQMQLMWKYALPILPKLDKEYEVAISYLWPHYFVAEKVKAKKKIAWIHTDFTKININKNMDLKVWEKFDEIVAVSDECRNAFLKIHPKLENKTLVIENIMSPKFIREMANENICEEIIVDSNFNLITVARLSHAKGIDNAVKALKILHDKGFTNIKWYVVGYGGDEDMLNKLINENGLDGSFVLLGKKINPYPYMRECDLYVQPSRYEGKAVTVTEAQILGKPVLITNYTTAQSQVKNGIDGYITELSVEGIADGIEKLFENEHIREELSENCEKGDYGNNYELEKLYNLI